MPPGQYVTRDFPVLSAGPTPHTPLDRWDFTHRRRDRRAAPLDLGGDARACPARRSRVDIHCVTKWSKLDTVWRGVSVDTLLDGVETAAEYVVQFADGGYTTNLPLEDLTGGKAWIVFEYDGEPLAAAARRSGADARAAPLLLEEREVGAGAAPRGGSTSPASGRPTGTTTTEIHGGSSGTGATDLAGSRTSSSVIAETPHVKTIAFDVPGWPGHRAGQHVDVRLTADDGYQARAQLLDRIGAGRRARRAHGRAHRRRRGLPVPRPTSYGRATRSSCAVRSAATSSGSPPLGGPLLLVAGGSGIVPLMAMIRLRAVAGQRCRHAAARSRRAAGTTSSTATSSQRLNGNGLTVVHTLTRRTPPGWTGYARRVDAAMLAEVGPGPAERPAASTSAARRRSSRPWRRRWCTSGTSRERIKTERFGPTGG